MVWGDLGLLAGAYLLGAVPTAWLVTRRSRQIDLRDYGSGNVGASNVLQQVGWRAALLVAASDVLKGLLPPLVLVARGRPLEAVVLAGLLAVIGHNWSVFLGGSGGRGVATLGGAMLALAVASHEPLAFGAAVLVIAVGLAVHLAAPATLAAALLATALTIFLPAPLLLSVAWGSATGLLILKRLLGNPPRPGLPAPPITLDVLWHRLIYDRDVRDGAAWVHRAPHAPAAASSRSETEAEVGPPPAR